jgi:uncharacterized membrane protein
MIRTILLAGLLAGCASATNAPKQSIDEHAIADVWHQAKLRGVAFRAIGQEPGWLLEITEGEGFLLVTDYGSNRDNYVFVEPQVDVDARRTRYVLSEGPVIEIRGEPCTDTMSGESFAVTVTIFLPERTLHGCGRALY